MSTRQSNQENNVQKLRQERDRLEKEWQLLQKAEPSEDASVRIIQFIGKNQDPILMDNEWNTPPKPVCC